MALSSIRLLLAVVAAVAGLSCGDSSDDLRPIELLYFVQGPTGTRFAVVGPDDNDDCLAPSREQPAGFIPSGGFGFQSRDATHLLPGTFRAPHFFVFENERQPTRGVFRNLGDAPLTVLQFRGAAQPGSTIGVETIAPGACLSVSTFPDGDEIDGRAPPFVPDNQFRFEICSFLDGVRLPEGFRCQDLAPRGPIDRDADGDLLFDAGIGFFASVGDLTASFLSRCLGLDPTEVVECRTPATFFMHDPQDQISAAMTRLANQPDSFMQLDLYRGDQLLDSSRGGSDVFVRVDL